MRVAVAAEPGSQRALIFAVLAEPSAQRACSKVSGRAFDVCSFQLPVTERPRSSAFCASFVLESTATRLCAVPYRRQSSHGSRLKRITLVLA